jgi:alpha-galactosidase
MEAGVRKSFTVIVAAVVVAAGGTLTGSLATVTQPPKPAYALENGLVRTPPMGFNNWNATGCAIDESLVTATADFFVSSGLKAAGYQYVNVDDCWAAPGRDPQTGRLVADPVRFSHGIAWLADYVHARGLKLGIYTSAGTQTCAKTMPGGLDHEEIDAQTFADWGVDYLKYDNCNNANRPALERYTKMRDALAKTGRPIVFSICEWGQNKPWEWGADVGNLWRTTGDINDSFGSVVSILKQNAPLAAAAGPGHWDDPDMLEVGNGGMTDTEYRSHFSLWAMMAAPLLIGSDLRKATPATMAILTNRDVIAVDQDPLGMQARVVSQVDGKWVMAKPLAGGDVAVALFNENDNATTIGVDTSALGLPRRDGYTVRDLWQHQTTETAGMISVAVPAHGTVVYRVGAGDWSRYQPAVSVGVDVAPPAPGIPGAIAPAGRPVDVTVTGTNRGRETVYDARLAFTAPTGWTVQAIRPGQARVLGTDESITSVWRVTPPAGTSAGDYPLPATLSHANGYHGRRVVTGTIQVRVPAPPPSGTADLSDVPWVFASNGYGPVEHDMSNGGPKAGDGFPLTINGVVYPKGLGTHAPAQLVFFVDGKCGNLTVDVGIDDDRNDARQTGSTTFEIWADGMKVADSGLRTWADPALTLSAQLTGAKYLKLVLTDGGNTNSYDRGDWAAPRLTC